MIDAYGVRACAARRAEFRLRTGQPLPARCDRARRRPASRASPSCRTTSPRRALRGCRRQGSSAWRSTRRSTASTTTATPADLLAHACARSTCACRCRSSGDQLVVLAPVLERSGVRVLIDHCGRPVARRGTRPAGLPDAARARRDEARVRQAVGLRQVRARAHPYDDARPYVDALLDAFTPDGCLWASDWPFLRAPERDRLRTAAEACSSASFPIARDRRSVLLGNTVPRARASALIRLLA